VYVKKSLQLYESVLIQLSGSLHTVRIYSHISRIDKNVSKICLSYTLFSNTDLNRLQNHEAFKNEKDKKNFDPHTSQIEKIIP